VKRPTLSILIPVFNRESAIVRAVDSIAAYRRNDVEIVIVDDASTDDTYSVCERLADENESIKLLRLRENVGPGLARKAGFELLTGEFVFFLDSDDVFKEGALESLIDLISRYRTVDFLLTCAERVEPSSYILYSHDINEGITSGDEFFRLWAEKTPAHPALWCFAFRVDFLRNKGIVFSSNRICEDLIYIYQCMAAARLTAVTCLVAVTHFVDDGADHVFPTDYNDRVLFQSELRLHETFRGLIDRCSAGKRYYFELVLEQHMFDLLRFEETFDINAADRDFRILSEYWLKFVCRLRDSAPADIGICPFGRYASQLAKMLGANGIEIGCFFDNFSPANSAKVKPLDTLAEIQPEALLIATNPKVIAQIQPQIEEYGYRCEPYSKMIKIMRKGQLNAAL
jgi:glycosyltransferase involved in cell wall biosynthesis